MHGTQWAQRRSSPLIEFHTALFRENRTSREAASQIFRIKMNAKMNCQEHIGLSFIIHAFSETTSAFHAEADEASCENASAILTDVSCKVTEIPFAAGIDAKPETLTIKFLSQLVCYSWLERSESQAAWVPTTQSRDLARLIVTYSSSGWSIRLYSSAPQK